MDLFSWVGCRYLDFKKPYPNHDCVRYRCNNVIFEVGLLVIKQNILNSEIFSILNKHICRSTKVNDIDRS